MALLDLHVRTWRAPLIVAHFDHRLRADSVGDADFVREAARAAGLDFVLGHWEHDRETTGIGLEAAARRARYRFLAATAREADLAVVATGHHRDDLTETVLMRLLRGTGAGGLPAMRPSRPLSDGIALVRPLLGFRRAEIRAYLSDRAIAHREDPTNREGRNLRSLLRHQLIPFLSEANPELPGRLAELARTAATRDWPALPEGINVPATLLHRPILLHRHLERILPPGAPGIDRRAFRDTRAGLVRRRGRVDLGRGWTLSIHGDRVSAEPPVVPREAPSPVLLSCPGEVTFGGRHLLRAFPETPPRRANGPDREVIDAALAPPPYEIRAVRSGDRFLPLGFPAETTVRRFLLSQRIPRAERADVPVMLSGGRVVWVVGHRIAHWARLTKTSVRGVRLSRTLRPA